MVMLSIYETICHGKNSIYGRLAAAGVSKPHKFISFYGLRNWAKSGEKFITEQVYIHSKMMIVDDRIAIIGSANINERSMLGNRDSEIAAVVRDQDYIDSTMNGVSYKVSRFAHTLRMNLMMEHLGLLAGHESADQSGLPFSEFDFVDPVHPAFYEDIWKHYAESNTIIYRDMFKCIPDNTVRSWSNYMGFIAESNVEDPRMDEEERTLKDKAINKILGPAMIEHFKPGEESSGEEDEDDVEEDFRARKGVKKILSYDDSDDEDPVKTKATPRRLSREERMRRNRFKAKVSMKPKNLNLRTDEKVTPKGRALEKAQEQIELVNHADLTEMDHEKVPVSPSSSFQQRGVVKRTASALAKSNDVRIAMESDLSKVQGHLVEWPLDFLRDEIEKHNFCYPKDYNHPIDLYT
ncbi:Phospholipase D1 [Modicella reniformis]|uniref:phospholipase D n=1 Tax=Modicella reniformis TaxID=1440133 RepID=A0A9P6SNL6_9FUNG|nr:Phospholipase D1 [Modicella reniformis]